MSPLRLEIRAISRLSIPVIAAHLATMLLWVVDLMMIGHVGVEELDAVALGRLWIMGTLVFAMGYGTLAGESKTLLVTRGAISARLEDQKRIVFDATINPGNSGGPLVDSLGRMVGVVVAKSSSSEEWVDSLAYAVDGRAVDDWLRKQKVKLKELPEAATSQTPPQGVSESVVRLLVGTKSD